MMSVGLFMGELNTRAVTGMKLNESTSSLRATKMKNKTNTAEKSRSNGN